MLSQMVYLQRLKERACLMPSKNHAFLWNFVVVLDLQIGQILQFDGTKWRVLFEHPWTLR